MSADSNPTEVFADVEPDPDAVLAEFDVDSPDDLAESAASDDERHGAHDPTRDDELDVDDTTAAELFADLADADPVAADDTESEDERTDPAPEDLAIEFVGDADATVRSDGDAVESSAAELSAVTEAEAEAEAEAETGTATERGTGSDTDTDSSADTSSTDGSSADDLTTADSSTDDSRDPIDTAADETADTDAAPADDDPTDSSAPLTVRTDDGADLELVGEPTSTRVSNDAFGSAGADAR